MVKEITVEKPLLKLDCTLGEGVVWDTRSQRLYFVDIDQKKVYTYEPSSGIHGFQLFENKVSSLSGTEKGDGLIATIDSGFAYIPFTSLPFPPTGELQPLVKIEVDAKVGPKEKRFNEGTVDPAGRFLSGTLGFDLEKQDGNMYALTKDDNDHHTAPHVLGPIGCTNGMGWSLDHKTMYFTDSWIDAVGEISAFDYDVATGAMTNRRQFSKLPIEWGQPDGMCTDAEGGVWVARWAAGKVTRQKPSGEIDFVINLPTAWLITCVVFGGPNLEDLYITTANSGYIGDDLPDRYDGGSLFVVKNVGFKGVERFRFKGGVVA